MSIRQLTNHVSQWITCRLVIASISCLLLNLGLSVRSSVMNTVPIKSEREVLSVVCTIVEHHILDDL